MKKILVIIIAWLFLSGVTYAWGEKSWYNAPIVSDSFNFIAKLDNNKVNMSWSAFSKEDWESFKYYKVVRSSNNSNPVYPEDWYIKYSSETNFTSYTDDKPQKWNNYYRICAIFEKNRYCSKVINIIIEWVIENKIEAKNEIQPQKPEPNKKPKMNYENFDKIIDKFEKVLSEKVKDDLKKIEKIDIVILKLNNLKKSKTYMSDVTDYLIKKLEELKVKYSDSEITNIFEVE